MTGTPAPHLDLVAAKMHEHERNNEELIALTMAPVPEGWVVVISTDSGQHEYVLDPFGYSLSDRPPVVLEVVA